MTEAVDNDVTVQITWDSLGRKTSEKSGPNPISTYGKTTSYTYDAASNLTSIDYPDGSFSVDRTYDDVNRLTLVEDGTGADIVATEWDSTSGRMKKLTFGNGTTANYGYDGFGRTTDIDHKTSTPTTFAGFDMVYDDAGNILTEEWSHDSGKGNVYTYDKAYRLTKALIRSVDPSAELASPGSQAYSNKLEYNLSDDSDRSSLVLTPYGMSAVTTNYTSNNVHEYTVAGGVNRTYDDNGNLIDDGTNDFEYDYRNQIVRVTRQSDSTVIGEYEYDALGRRTRKTLEDSSEVRWYHDGVHEIEEFDENGVLLRKFVYRDDIDSILMMEAPDQADVDDDTNASELKRFYFHYDGRTNVSRLTDNDEQVVESYETDPYGAVSIKDQGGSPASVSPVGNPFTFQRRRLDDETGLYYFRARHYDPVVGQWLQRDPLGCSPKANWREFESSGPVGNADPFGLEDDKGESKGFWTETLNAILTEGASDALDAFLIGGEARVMAAASGFEGASGGLQDAYRHCWWQCQLAKRLGTSTAESFGNNHEQSNTVVDKSGHLAPGSAMDLWNNRQGRICATRRGSCDECCRSMIASGHLLTIESFRPRGTPTGGGEGAPPPSSGGSVLVGSPSSATPVDPPTKLPRGGKKLRGNWLQRLGRWIWGSK